MVNELSKEEGLAYLRSRYREDGLNSAIKIVESLGI